MSDFFNRFSLQSVKFGSAVGVCMAAIWLSVLWCTIASIWTQPFSRRQRTFWIVLVIALPLVGVLAYLPFSFRREDLPLAFLLRAKDRTVRSRRSRRATAISGGTSA